MNWETKTAKEVDMAKKVSSAEFNAFFIFEGEGASERSRLFSRLLARKTAALAEAFAANIVWETDGDWPEVHQRDQEWDGEAFKTVSEGFWIANPESKP